MASPVTRARSAETPREVRAQAKYVRMSPRKARLVAEHIRGRSVPEARAVLAFTSREAAGVLQKVLQSAVSNAEANHGIAEERLYVKATYVDRCPDSQAHLPHHCAACGTAASCTNCGACAGRGRGGVKGNGHTGPEENCCCVEEKDSDQASREEEGSGCLMGQKVHP